jgi:hypothetical protein
MVAFDDPAALQDRLGAGVLWVIGKVPGRGGFLILSRLHYLRVRHVEPTL